MNYSFIQGLKYYIGIPNSDRQVAIGFAQRFQLSMPLAYVLVHRKFTQVEEVEHFLIGDPEKDIADTHLMKDALKAVERIMLAIKNGEKILISGDYDVDGITSSSLMLMGLLPLGAKVNFFLPNRVKDGYGLSKKIVQKAYDNGYRLLITVDNGITAFEPVSLATQLGLDVIITDHHKPHDKIPQAYAVVDPHQHDCKYPYKYFAGVGVAFKIISLLYQKMEKNLPDKVIELLLLGTVADVVPLTGENRYWVRYGLQYINRYESYAMSVLKQNALVVKPELLSSDIGFSITPQINALGRLDDAREGVQFLIGNDAQQVDRIGKTLQLLNDSRKQIERSIVEQVVAQIESGMIDISGNIIIAGSYDWPSGVIGLVASRIVGLYGMPVILCHFTKDGIAKGSCRSIKEFNVFDALSKSKDLLITFGGHAHAAGLSLKTENIPVLHQRLKDCIAQELTEFDLRQKLLVDAHATLSDFSGKMMDDLRLFEPFGHENPQPYFYIKQVTLVQQPQLLKELHVKCMVFADGVIKSVMFFNRPELYAVLTEQADQPFDLIGQVLHNYWNGSYSIEIQGVDVVGVKRS